MKPNFALTLSFDGISLLHRAFPGWHLVGEVALDVANLDVEMNALRRKALALDPSGLRTKLVLPNDQIKYLKIEAPDADDLVGPVQDALKSATPYALSDLDYVWAEQGGQLYIAAVAHETLSEAEAFALVHQFNPVSFVAKPESSQFFGEPFFGITRQIQAQGISLDDIERDSAPVRVIGASKLPEAPSNPPAAVQATPPQASASQNVEEHALQVETLQKSEDTAAVMPEYQHGKPAETEDRQTSDIETLDKDAPDQQASIASPKYDTESQAAFSSIRATRGETGTASPRLAGVMRDQSTPPTDPRVDGAINEPENTMRVTGVADATLPEDDVPRSAMRPSLEDRLDKIASGQGVPAVEESAPVPLEPEPLPPETPVNPSTSFSTRRSRRLHQKQAQDHATPTDEESQRLTVFGAREEVVVGGKPRFLGLILTAILLLFLVGVAAWASIFMDEGFSRFFRDDQAPVVASVPIAEEEPAFDEDPIELAAIVPEEPLTVLDDPATEILSRVTPKDLSPDEAKARYAATGIWQLAPDPPALASKSELEEFYQTTLDPDLDFGDAVALPDALATFSDGRFLAPASPPAAETTFALDARGLVIATAAGALTPDDIRVFAGKPAVVPPPSVMRGEPLADTSQTAPNPDNALAAIRPQARPADAAEQIERNELGGRTRSELASLRPKLRPVSAQEAAAARTTAQTEANAAAQASTVDLDALEGAIAEAVAQPDPFADATAQAVAVSLKPSTRPSNFANIVSQTRNNTAQAQAQTQAQETQATEPVQIAAAQKVAPRIPSSASVSKAATEKNALKFKRVNLIGVYGTSSDRRALVRMSNGRYKKVKVGDRLDGGKVNAIGESELRYQKGGRSIVLKMPRG